MKFIQYNNSSVRYLTFGKGEKLLIAIHGFADAGAAMFEILEDAIGAQYTIYAFDMPYHQKTVWEGDSYSKKDISHIIKTILDKSNHSRFTLMGYSMGGRIALGLLEEYIGQLDKLYLVGSDGLPEGKIIHAHMMPLWIRKGLAKMVRNPNWLLRLSQRLYKWGLLSSLAANFIKKNLADEFNRNRLLNTWISLYEFIIPTRKTKNLIRQHQLPVEMVMGTRDTVILEAYGRRFAKNLPNARLHLLDSSHRLVNEKLGELLRGL